MPRYLVTDGDEEIATILNAANAADAIERGPTNSGYEMVAEIPTGVALRVFANNGEEITPSVVED